MVVAELGFCRAVGAQLGVSLNPWPVGFSSMANDVIKAARERLASRSVVINCDH